MAKKVFSVFLCSVLLLLTMSVGVSAQSVQEENNQQIQPRWSYTSFTAQNIYISNGQIACHGEAEGYPGTTTKVTITLYLQKKTLFWWSDEEEWSFTYQNYRGSLTGKTSMPESGTYRTKAVYTVYSGSSSETITGYSSELKI